MLEDESKFIICSSVTASLPEPKRFGLKETIEVANGRANGVQLYINPERQHLLPEDILALKKQLQESGLTTNIVHLPGYLVPPDLEGSVRNVLHLTSTLLDPIPHVGKVAVIHHLPFSEFSDDEIISSVQKVLAEIGDPDLTIGFEHYHPPKQTNQGNLSEQVDRYIALLYKLQKAVPTIAVFDVGRFYTVNANNDGKPLTDPNYMLMRRMCEAVKGQNVLLHVADIRDNTIRYTTPGNPVPVGTTGVLTPVYKELATLGKEYGISWIGAVDETEDINAISDKDIVRSIFR